MNTRERIARAAYAVEQRDFGGVDWDYPGDDLECPADTAAAYEIADAAIAIVREALLGTQDWHNHVFDFTAIDAGIQALRDIPFNRGEAKLAELDKRSSVSIMVKAMIDAAFGEVTTNDPET